MFSDLADIAAECRPSIRALCRWISRRSTSRLTAAAGYITARTAATQARHTSSGRGIVATGEAHFFAEITMTTGRSAKGSRTQWTAQFLVAAEPARRDYTVAFTMGNHTPVADLIIGHLPSGTQFLVNVKGLASPGSWLVELEGKPTIEGLNYILVLVGTERGKDRFFCP